MIRVIRIVTNNVSYQEQDLGPVSTNHRIRLKYKMQFILSRLLFIWWCILRSSYRLLVAKAALELGQGKSVCKSLLSPSHFSILVN